MLFNSILLVYKIIKILSIPDVPQDTTTFDHTETKMPIMKENFQPKVSKWGEWRIQVFPIDNVKFLLMKQVSVTMTENIYEISRNININRSNSLGEACIW